MKERQREERANGMECSSKPSTLNPKPSMEHEGTRRLLHSCEVSRMPGMFVEPLISILARAASDVVLPLKGLYRDYMGIMEKKMETTI